MGQSGTTQHGGRKVGKKKKSGKHPTFTHPEPRPTTPAAYVWYINVFIPKFKYQKQTIDQHSLKEKGLTKHLQCLNIYLQPDN